MRGNRQIIDDLVAYIHDDVMPAITPGRLRRSLAPDRQRDRPMRGHQRVTDRGGHARVEKVRLLRQWVADMLGATLEIRE